MGTFMTSFKFRVRSLGIMSGLCLAMLTPSIASAIIIDSFTNAKIVTRTANLPYNVATSGGLESGLSGVVNTGDRTASVQILTGSTTTSVNRESKLDIGGGELAFSNSTGVLGKFTIAYTNIGVVDASATGSALFFQITENDAGGTFQLTLSDGTNTQTASQGLAAALLGTVTFQINAGNFGTITRSAITSITLMFTAAAVGGDLSLENGINLATVPEPSSLAIALTGLGLAGVYFRRRRKQLTA